MASASDAELEALEKAILGTLETLERLDEFALPSPTPDNAGLALNLCGSGRQLA